MAQGQRRSESMVLLGILFLFCCVIPTLLFGPGDTWLERARFGVSMGGFMMICGGGVWGIYLLVILLATAMGSFVRLII
jgi:hypothetical protein